MLCYIYAIQCHDNEKQFKPEYFLYCTLKINISVIIIGREAQITRKQYADVP